MSATVIPLYPDLHADACALTSRQKQNAVQSVITIILQRAQLAKSAAELSACRMALRNIEIFAAAAGDLVGELQDKREREQ